jgi:thiosulfate sulfurtransferase
MQLARQLGQEGYRTATVVGGYEAMRKLNKKVPETYFKNGRNV